MQPQEQKTTKAHGMDEGHRQNDWKKPDTKEKILCVSIYVKLKTQQTWYIILAGKIAVTLGRSVSDWKEARGVSGRFGNALLLWLTWVLVMGCVHFVLNSQDLFTVCVHYMSSKNTLQQNR